MNCVAKMKRAMNVLRPTNIYVAAWLHGPLFENFSHTNVPMHVYARPYAFSHVYANLKELGRFSLRRADRIIAVGIIKRIVS